MIRQNPLFIACEKPAALGKLTCVRERLKLSSELSAKTTIPPPIPTDICAPLKMEGAMPAAIEKGWAYLLDNLTPFQLTAVTTIVLHELFYWGAYIPFLVADMLPGVFGRWKIQAGKINDRATILGCVWRVVLSHLFVTSPLILLMHFVEGAIPSSLPLPSVAMVAGQVVTMMVIEDFFFYWGHRALHTPFLYRHIHSIHHRFSTPVGISAEYAHPAEMVFLGLATGLGPMVLRPHLFTLWCYLFVRLCQTVECHSGYDFPWSVNRWFPLYGGADFHDHHHKSYSGNYASTFIWTDFMLGTDSAYREWKSKQATKTLEAKKGIKSL